MENRRKSKGRKLGSSRKLMIQQNEPEEIKTEMSPKTEEEAYFDEMMERVQSMFSAGEEHSKIFITRDDMEKVSSIIFCGTEDLELIFDELNSEEKGYITYEEFHAGMRNFIQSGKSPWNQTRKRKSTRRIAEIHTMPSLEEVDNEERKQFLAFMEQLGANNIFEDETEIWNLWKKLGQDEPHLLGNLEEFLAKVTSQIKESKQDKEKLEMALKKRISEHKEEVKHLYEEMEQQISAERKRLLNESDARNTTHSKEVQNLIHTKNKEVQQLIAVQDELEKELKNLKSNQHVTKSENEKLKHTNQDLQQQLEKIRGQLSVAQDCVSEMRQKADHHGNERNKIDIDELSSSQLEKELQNLRSNQHVTKSENEKLKQTNQDLEQELEKIRGQLSEAQDHVSVRRQKADHHGNERDSIDIDGLTASSSQFYKIFFQEQPKKNKDKELEELNEDVPIELVHRQDPTETVPQTFPNLPYTDPGQRRRVISIEEDPMPECFMRDPKLFEKNIVAIQEETHHSYNEQEERFNPQHISGEAEKYFLSERNQFYQFSITTSMQKHDFQDSSLEQSTFSDHKQDQTQMGTRESKAVLDQEFSQTEPYNVGDMKSHHTLQSGRINVLKAHVYPTQRPQDITGEGPDPFIGKNTDLVTNAMAEGGIKGTEKDLEDAKKAIGDTVLTSKLHNKDLQSLEDNKEKDHLHSTEIPDYVYKILFVGNSNVGKTAFLHRVHEGSFSRDTSATIGVDYRIKTLTIDNKSFALQLWDTAGQERFHSITQQFFRKADGIVLMYDVTAQDTFAAVQYWLRCIKERVEEDIVILLIGNKVDCESIRKVSTEDGEKLAREYKLLFRECSAASGINLMESLTQLARCLKKHEDEMRTNVLHVRSQPGKKRSCCT
ncbi:EF-hand calcium-binding domain-containing protein 4B-like isoform 2-T2 [Discoglossus pictus]